MAKKKTVKSKSNYEIPFSGNDRKTVHRIIDTNLKRGTNPNDIYKLLKDKGYGYRKQNVLADIRLKNATRNAKSPQARKRAEKWFKNVFEPYRKQNKLNSKSAKLDYDRMVKTSYDTVEQARRVKSGRLHEMYSVVFKKSPEPDKR